MKKVSVGNVKIVIRVCGKLTTEGWIEVKKIVLLKELERVEKVK